MYGNKKYLKLIDAKWPRCQDMRCKKTENVWEEGVV